MTLEDTAQEISRLEKEIASCENQPNPDIEAINRLKAEQKRYRMYAYRIEEAYAGTL